MPSRIKIRLNCLKCAFSAIFRSSSSQYAQYSFVLLTKTCSKNSVALRYLGRRIYGEQILDREKAFGAAHTVVWARRTTHYRRKFAAVNHVQSYFYSATYRHLLARPYQALSMLGLTGSSSLRGWRCFIGRAESSRAIPSRHGASTAPPSLFRAGKGGVTPLAGLTACHGSLMRRAWVERRTANGLLAQGKEVLALSQRKCLPIGICLLAPTKHYQCLA